MRIRLPNNWSPRTYQKPLWKYWVEQDGKHAEVIWHRRAGKDDVVLNGTAVKLHERPANYWHMLPQANQARKAIWEAVNPRTGRRRIDEAFPLELRSNTRESDMLIRFKNGATWQVLGSDNFQSAIGSTPAGIVYSEWALANPSARGYLRPILSENDGWQVYITTPRGKNHAYSTFQAALQSSDQFAQKLSIYDTGVLSADQLAEELKEYVATYGEEMGIALFEQEYECSFEAAILGAYYGAELRDLRNSGRITEVPHDPNYKVHVAFDIGFDDDTAIWWFQVIGGELRILEYFSSSGKTPDFYCSQLLGKDVELGITRNRITSYIGGAIRGLEHRTNYDYGSINLPHDAKAKTLAAMGKTIQEQFSEVFGWGKVRIVPRLSLEDGIQAVRKALGKSYFNISCEDGIACLENYQREWDDEKKMFKDKPLHDWSSHGADSFRYLAIAYQEEKMREESVKPRWAQDRTFNELVKLNTRKRLREDNG